MKRSRGADRCGGGLLMLGSGTALRAAEPITEEEAHAIGVDAYVYFYPLVTMDVTRQADDERRARPKARPRPMNTFAKFRRIPTADMRAVVRPNFDTLYSSGWLDLTKEPVIVSVPDTRRALLPAADARHVDRRVRLARLAHHRHAGAATSLVAAARLDRRRCPRRRSASTRRRRMSGSSAAPRPTDRRTTTPCTRSRPATRSRRCRNGASRPSRSTVTIDPDGGHEDPAEGPGRPHAGRTSTSPTPPSC